MRHPVNRDVDVKKDMKAVTYTSPMTKNAVRPLILRMVPNILAFGVGLGVAYFLKWQTKDLVWSLWLCSLVLGYLTLLSAIACGAYIGIQKIKGNHLTMNQLVLVVLAGIAVGVFFLAFFSIHFCGFHVGYSVFLQVFFPVEGVPSECFGSAFVNPPLLWFLVFKHLIRPYGLFLIPTIIAERKRIFRPLIDAVKSARDGVITNEPDTAEAGRGTRGDPFSLGDAMVRPYINVGRMHLLIFFFAFCHVLKVESFLVYALVYSVYFFPWSEIRKLKTRASNQQIQPIAGTPGSG